MKILNENKKFIALISALFLVGCSHFMDQIDDIEEELVVEQEVQETEKSSDQIWEELAEKDSKK
ncbi:MAG: hypothetical protein MK201_01475 [Gammaproteobacteria bacterium]|jgi:hypothetical protein|nr:hypothetical protein [Gammaproteobacteria bacterium]|tara:strand:+ start:941 stop:1132 length:192 start_codon:yes stop_codon:yes gene_type:complete